NPKYALMYWREERNPLSGITTVERGSSKFCALSFCAVQANALERTTPITKVLRMSGRQSRMRRRGLEYASLRVNKNALDHLVFSPMLRYETNFTKENVTSRSYESGALPIHK